jgi:predicted  nucleic acid-binding Zn-ribbon protein
MGVLAGCATRSVTIGGAAYQAKVRSRGYALEVGAQKISKNDFARKILELRSLYAEDLTSETEAFWQTKDDSGKTLSDSFMNRAMTELVEDALFAEQFAALGLELTEAQVNDIGDTMQSYEAMYGSRAALTEALAEEYYTYDEFRAAKEFVYKKQAVLDHLFPDFNETDAKTYYAQKNAVIRTIYISKLDVDEALLEGAELEEAKERAETALAEAQKPSDTDRFEELVQFHSDAESSFNAVVITKGGQYDEQLQEAVFKMEIGEVIMQEREDGFWIIKRYEATSEDLFGAEQYYAVLQEMKAKEIQSHLQKWGKEAKIYCNPSLMELCRPEKFMEQ